MGKRREKKARIWQDLNPQPISHEACAALQLAPFDKNLFLVLTQSSPLVLRFLSIQHGDARSCKILLLA